MTSKMLFAVNRWKGRAAPPEYLKFERNWTRKRPGDTVEVWNVFHPCAPGYEQGLNIRTGFWAQYLTKVHTNEQVVRKVVEMAAKDHIPYIGVMDDDAYMAPHLLEKLVIPAFEKYENVGQLAFYGHFNKMRLPASRQKRTVIFQNGHPWAAGGVMFYRTEAIMATRAYTFGVPVLEDTLAAMELEEKGWDLGWLLKGSVEHGQMFRTTGTKTGPEIARSKNDVVHAWHTAIQLFPQHSEYLTNLKDNHIKRRFKYMEAK